MIYNSSNLWIDLALRKIKFISGDIVIWNNKAYKNNSNFGISWMELSEFETLIIKVLLEEQNDRNGF